MTNSTQAKLLQLGKANHKRNGFLPVIYKGSQEFDMWISWRKRHGLGTSFMKERGAATVPMELPPENIDAELQRGNIKLVT